MIIEIKKIELVYLFILAVEILKLVIQILTIKLKEQEKKKKIAEGLGKIKESYDCSVRHFAQNKNFGI